MMRSRSATVEKTMLTPFSSRPATIVSSSTPTMMPANMPELEDSDVLDSSAVAASEARAPGIETQIARMHEAANVVSYLEILIVIFCLFVC